ncbi:hypothetical protein QTP88_012560 [Uroleucon formosanum]
MLTKATICTSSITQKYITIYINSIYYETKYNRKCIYSKINKLVCYYYNYHHHQSLGLNLNFYFYNKSASVILAASNSYNNNLIKKFCAELVFYTPFYKLYYLNCIPYTIMFKL